MSQRGPGPDWNIQEGYFEPVGTAAEAIRRSVLGSLPSTGHLIWGSSFNANNAEVRRILNGATAEVSWTDWTSNSGGGSLILRSGDVVGNYAGIERVQSPLTVTRTGIAFAGYPEVDPAGGSLTDLEIGIIGNYYGMGNDKRVNARLRISREVGGTVLYYYNAAGAWIDTGIAVGEFFINAADAFPFSWWRSIKFVIDPIPATPRYKYLEIDGARLNLSAFTPQTAAPVVLRPYLWTSIIHYTQEAINKNLYVDDFGITDVEP